MTGYNGNPARGIDPANSATYPRHVGEVPRAGDDYEQRIREVLADEYGIEAGDELLEDLAAIVEGAVEQRMLDIVDIIDGNESTLSVSGATMLLRKIKELDA